MAAVLSTLSRIVAALVLAFALAACGKGDSDRPVEVVVIGAPGAAFIAGPRLSPAAQLLRNATLEGLVGIDEQGRVIPALADRWIVTDDGQSYIFRLRDGTWSDGSPITADSAAAALRRALTPLRGTALGRDLGDLSQIRVMAGRVIELRLAQPVPDLLQLLAQPELGLAYRGRGNGPMALRRNGDTARLIPIAPEKRGLPAEDGWNGRFRALVLRSLPGQAAFAAFDAGEADVVLGGGIEQFPRTQAAGISRGAIHLDPVLGLFGLAVVRADGFLAAPENREAIAMAIDRDSLIAPFGVGGWTPTTRVIAPGLTGDTGLTKERWLSLSLTQRRSEAGARVTRAKKSGRALPRLRIALPAGPGSDLLFSRIAADLAAIGLDTARVGENDPADLRLLDMVARYARADWFFNQLACANRAELCSPAADARAEEARLATAPATRAAFYAEAEAELTSSNVYIPFGPPVRWSLVRGDIAGFAENRWGFHPLMPLATRPK